MFFRPGILVLVAALAVAGCKSVEERANEHYQSGIALAAEGDFDRAIIEFRNVFKLDESHREARQALADILLKEKDNPRAAYGQYLRLAEQFPDDLEARIVLGNLAFDASSWDELERHGKTAEELDAGDPRVRALTVARAYRDAARSDDASTLREQAQIAIGLLESLPDSTMLRSIIVDNQVREGELRKAIASLDALIELKPDEQRYWRQRLNVLAELQDFDGLEAQLKEMVGRFPDETSHKSTLIRFYLARRENDKAEAFLRDLVAKAEDGSIGPRVDLIRFLTEVRSLETGRAEVTAAIADFPEELRFNILAASMDFQSGQRDKAISSLEDIVETTEPSDLTREAKIVLARMLMTTGNQVGARVRIEEVLNEDPENVSALKMQANWLIDADETERAIAGLRIALDNESEDVEAMTLMARAYQRSGQEQLSRDFLALAADASGNAPEETLRYARALIEEGDFLPAEDVLLPALRLDPQNTELLIMAGQLYLRMNDLARAEQAVRSLRALEDDERAQQAANGIEAEIINQQSGPQEAMAFLEDIAKSADASLTSKVALVRARLATNDAAGALELARELLARDPENEALQTMTAVVASANGNLDEAEEIYSSLLTANPERAQLWLEMSRIKARRGQPEQAEELIREGLALLPDDANLLWAQASLLERDGKIEEAIAVYETLYERNSNSIVVANNLASLITTYRSDLESLERAWKIARRLKDAQIPALQDTYGWIAHRRGDSEGALPYLQSAAEGLPEDPLVQYHLGVVYQALNQPEQALAQFRRAVEIAGPTDQRDQIDDARAQIAELQNTDAKAEN
ncbi:MAG: tetratricopeptide repeat protein [Pseudomonadota bacterium]